MTIPRPAQGAPTSNAPRQLLACDLIGARVLFYSQSFTNPEHPRVADISGAGVRNTDANASLTVIHHPVIDCLNKGKAPSAIVRNIPVFPTNFTGKGPRPAHYAVLLSDQAPSSPTREAPREVPPKARAAAFEDLGDLGDDRETQRRAEPGQTEEAGAEEGEAETAAEPELSAEEAACQTLYDGAAYRAAFTQIEGAGSKVTIGPNGMTISPPKGLAYAQIGFAERSKDNPPGFNLDVILPNGKGIKTVMSGVNSTRKTDPGPTIHKMLEALVSMAASVDEADPKQVPALVNATLKGLKLGK